MRFSDLNRPDPGRRAPRDAGPGGDAAAPKKRDGTPVREAAPAEEKVLPLDAPLPDFPVLKFPTREPVPAEPAPAPAPAPAPETVPPARKTAGRRAPLPPAVPERPYAELDRRAKDIYVSALNMARELVSRIDRSYIDNSERFLSLADLISGELLENPALLHYTVHSTADDYLYAHSANTAVISLAAGLNMGLRSEELRLLGFCAFAHDLGMTEHADLANSERRLTDQEYEAIKAHSGTGAEKLDRMLGLPADLKQRAKQIILQVHERVDTGGYPGGLAMHEIDPLAQLIGIADIYEAMTHPRTWRPASHPHVVIKHLIDKEGQGFTPDVVKGFIRGMSLYPPGGLVTLTGGEIAEVLAVNRETLTRPIVSVLLNKDFSPLPPRVMNLRERALSGIEDMMDESVVAARNPEFAAKRELSRWWVEW